MNIQPKITASSIADRKYEDKSFFNFEKEPLR